MDYKWDFIDEEGRKEIFEWSIKRQEKYQGCGKSKYEFMTYIFNLKTLESFLQNFNFLVIMQMALAGVAVYIFKRYDIFYDVHIGLFVSPIVFPLAFSINTDFQRREKVLEDLATFKSSSMVWFFCMRDWKEGANLDDEWMKAVHQKVKSMLFHLREYLLTSKLDRRKVILKAMYEDFSDSNQLIERVRASKLPANPAIISRAIHLLKMMVLSFERLRVIREYRSPRSIRSFNKVLIFFLPFILAPYFVYLGKRVGQNQWSPYFLSVLTAFIFGALQGVQDKLDDPFDGFGEDDIDVKTIDEWTFQSLEVTADRKFIVGRFQVLARAESFIETIRKNSFDNNVFIDLETSTALQKTNEAQDKRRKSSGVKTSFKKEKEKSVRKESVEQFNRRGLPGEILSRLPSNSSARLPSETISLDVIHESTSEEEQSYVTPLRKSNTSAAENEMHKFDLNKHPFRNILEKLDGDKTITKEILLERNEENNVPDVVVKMPSKHDVKCVTPVLAPVKSNEENKNTHSPKLRLTSSLIKDETLHRPDYCVSADSVLPVLQNSSRFKLHKSETRQESNSGEDDNVGDLQNQNQNSNMKVGV